MTRRDPPILGVLTQGTQNLAAPGQEPTAALHQEHEGLYEALLNSGQAVTPSNGPGNLEALLDELLAAALAEQKAEEDAGARQGSTD